MRKTAWLINFVLVLLLLTASSVRAVMASPHLSLSPSSGNYSVNDTFSVIVKVDSGSEVVGGVDAMGTYDSSRLELVSVTKASDMVFDESDGGGYCRAGESNSGGKFGFGCGTNDNLTDKSVNGSLMVLNFKAKAVGTATVAFTCTAGSTTDTNIVKTSPVVDVIVCGENVGGSYIINAASSDSSSDTATATSTPTSATLPKTGTVGVTLGLVAFGLVTVLSAVFLKFL